uniref:Uncharacterized protein n=1 Tax=Oryza brachyantha TaxID=4533 RepID=J3M273_ORYBR
MQQGPRRSDWRSLKEATARAESVHRIRYWGCPWQHLFFLFSAAAKAQKLWLYASID